jgi:sucrose phosphorylase
MAKQSERGNRSGSGPMENKIIQNRIKGHLTALYGEEIGQDTWLQLLPSLESFQEKFPHLGEENPLDNLASLDALLITYADQFQSPGKNHLQSLSDFIKDHLYHLVSAVHILPFFPYSSDDGFSVIDYKKINPEVGEWHNLKPLQECCQLMFDAVVNHISSHSIWFQKFLQEEDPYQDYFITIDPGVDLSWVVRPRAKPLLTQVETTSGPKHVWTTFSPDQIDLDYSNPAVLLEIINVLLFYIQQGARLIRLDAIAYIWKEIDTSCIHLPQTHQVIKLIRAVLDAVAPGVLIITETNVPHQENISYFGSQLSDHDGSHLWGDEAQMVYQFPLAPLVLHTFRTENASALTKWAKSLSVPYTSAAFLNFIASHDGIGVRPAEGLLSGEEIQGLVDQTMGHGGQVSYKTNQDGSKSVYELNITLYDALNHPGETSQELGLKRFLASQAIMLSLAGVPGIYVHSLFGSPNDHQGVKETGRARSINREKFHFDDLEEKLRDNTSQTAKVLQAYKHFLEVRKVQPAFKPLSPQQILDLDKRVFALLRFTVGEHDQILCLINISNQEISLKVDQDGIDPKSTWRDLLTDQEINLSSLSLESYQVLWLKEV